MPNQSLDVLIEPFLISAPAGDILAARAVAVRALGKAIADGGQLRLATLYLTAALLQCAIHDGEGVTLPALVAYLNELRLTGLPGREMNASPLQFCRYAAAEMNTLSPIQRSNLITTLLAAAAEPTHHFHVRNRSKGDLK